MPGGAWGLPGGRYSPHRCHAPRLVSWLARETYVPWQERGVCICRWCRWRRAKSGKGERELAVETSQREMEEGLSHRKRAIEKSCFLQRLSWLWAHGNDVRTPSRALRNGDSYPVSWRLASVADTPVTPLAAVQIRVCNLRPGGPYGRSY